MRMPYAAVFITLLTTGVAHAADAIDAKPASESMALHEQVIFDGLKGWEHDGVIYRLACGAAIAEAPNGDLLVRWLSGSDSEPATDNNVLISRSTDKGKTWSEPAMLMPATDMAGAVSAMYTISDGRMIAFAARWPSEKRYTVWYYERWESTDNGHTWNKLEPVELHGNNISFGGPIKLQNGEFLFPASFFDQRPKPLVAPVSALVHARDEAEALAMPPGDGPRHDEKFSTHLHGCSVLITKNEDGTDLEEFGHIADRPLGLLEPSCVQLKDGRIVMLMRAEMAGYLWRAESRDDGRTWTDARQTDIPNPTSAIQLIRLPDGRIALLHNACGEVGKMIPRDPLSIWLSDDEMESWSVKADVATGGWLAYPNAIILDGRLVFVYDRNRRQAVFAEVDVPPLNR